ncbi:hypothetical protein I4P06_03320 [Enterobacter asburiae]|uniref:hypothetical protein n=1 Tax=Enterobacter asburiae TaxID=61645 RepID=UPI0018C1F6B5|nr:hypothetical protein [Enterobacter asburiae]MBG0637040.1 hypothetical protein [Enterobacter asburiae]
MTKDEIINGLLEREAGSVNVDAPVSVMQSNEVGKNFSNRKGAESIGNLVKNVVQTEITRRLRKEIAPGGNLYNQK